MHFSGDNTDLGYNFQRSQNMNCPCEECHCGKPRGRKRKRHQYQSPKIYQPSTFQPCVHRFFKIEPVDRECLSREQYMDMLATPKRYPWVGETDFDNAELCGKKSKNKKPRRTHEEELASLEHGCKDFSFAEEFINDMWDVMSPDVTDRLIDFLVSEFGTSVEEAEDFIDCKSSVGKPTPCAKKQFKAIVNLGPKQKLVSKFSEVLANRIEQYICSILMDRKSLRVQKIAKKILNDICGLTGDITSLKNPKTKCERTMVIIATRMAFWFEDIFKDLNQRPSESKEEKSIEKDKFEEKEDWDGEDDEGDEELEETDKEPPKEEKEEEGPEETEGKKPVSGERAVSSEEKSPAEEKTPILEEKSSEKETTNEDNSRFKENHPEDKAIKEAPPTIEGELLEDKTTGEEHPKLEGKPPDEESIVVEPTVEGEPSEEEKTENERPAEEETEEEDQSPVEEETSEESEKVHDEEPQAKERIYEEEESADNESASLTQMHEKELSEEVVPFDEIPSWEQVKSPDHLRYRRVPSTYKLVLPKKVLPTFEVRAKTGSTFQIQTLSDDTVAKQTAQARGLLAPPQRKVPASESPLNLKSAEEWVDWVKNIANMADEWGKWLESRFTDAEKQLTEKRKHSDWKALMAQAHTEALKWRVEEERVKEEGERWSRKLYKQNKEQSQKIVKTTIL